MFIDIRNIDWSHLVLDWLEWPEQELRRADSATLYAWEFKLLPWIAVLFVAPRNHIFGCVPESSAGATLISTDIGPTQVAWNHKVFQSGEARRLFRKELKQQGIDEGKLRHGLLPY